MEKVKNGLNQEVTERQEESYKSGSVQYIDSREVAAIVEKRHDNLKRDIAQYRKELDNLNFEDNEFFIESSYKDNMGRTQKCYLVTRKGCEFIAHKLTGEKGTKFTATYINRFHEMKGMLEGHLELDKLYDAISHLADEQQKLKKLVMDRVDDKDSRCNTNKTPFNHEYSLDEMVSIEKRKKELYGLTAKVAELCEVPHTALLHQAYQAIERKLGIALNCYRSVYQSETGNQDAGIMEVIAAHDWIYESMLDLCNYVIRKKSIFD